MCSKAQDFNKKILKDIIKLVEQLDSDFNNALKNLLTSEYSKIKETFKTEIQDLILIIESNKDPLDENYLKDLQNNFDNIKQKHKIYNEVIIEIYENIYIKKIRKYNEELNVLINKIIPDFKPPNVNSFSSDVHLNLHLNHFSTYTESCNAGQNGLSYSSFYDEENKKNQTQENISQSFENNYICTICHKEKAIKICDECNQLVCQICEKTDKWTNNCNHDLKKINNINNSNEIGKILYLNSLNNFIKKMILKSNYLFKNESQEIKLNNDSDSNSSKYIQKTLFEYPNMNIIDDLTEEKYFKNINDILENKYGIKNLDIKDFNKSEIDQRLVNLLKKIYKENKQSQFNSISTDDISKSISENEGSIDDELKPDKS